MLNKSGSPTVKLKGRSVISYEEGTKKVFFDSELLQGESDLVIYFEDTKFWCEPDSSILISPEEKKRIKLAISAEMEKNNIKIEWG